MIFINFVSTSIFKFCGSTLFLSSIFFVGKIVFEMTILIKFMSGKNSFKGIAIMREAN